MKVWSEDNNFHYLENETIAEYLVRAYLHNELGKDVSYETGTAVAIVWQCYILGNRKYLITTVNDPMDYYFEVTYSTDKDEWYLDVYGKKQNYRLGYDYINGDNRIVVK